MKKLKTLIVFALVLALGTTSMQGLFAQEADYVLIASKSGLVEQTDFAPVELSLKNNTGVPITIGDIDVQRVQLPFVTDTMETIAQIPEETINDCKAVVGAIDETGPDGDCINMNGEWYRNTLSGSRDDVLPQPTIQPGETAVIAEISTGMPASWRGWYGGGWVDFIAWINITPLGSSETEWRSEFVRHFIMEGEAGPNAWFEQDNGDGTATFIVTGLESGLTKENFNIYQRIDDVFAGNIGTIVSVTENDEGSYIIIWRHLIANHNGVVISAENNAGENILDFGDIETVTVSSSAIPRTFATTDGKEVTSNMADIKDLANTDVELKFTLAGFGSISFDPGLNIFDNKEELEQLAGLLVIAYDEETNEMKASVDTKSLTFLADHGANIEFFGVAEKMGLENLTEENLKDYLDITVYDNGEAVGNISDYFDWDDVTYDPETDVLTLPVKHFTEYVLGEATVEAETLTETGAAIIGAVAFALVSLTAYAIVRKQKFLTN